MRFTKAQLKLIFDLLETEIEVKLNSGYKPQRGTQAMYDRLFKHLYGKKS